MSDTQSEVAVVEAKAAKPKTEYTEVIMDDGRAVEFAGKRNILKQIIINEDNTVSVRFDFRNGETRLFTVPQSLLLNFAGHGASQKIGDEAAGLTDIEDAILAVDDIMDRLNAGEWVQKRESSGLAGASVLAKALIEVSGKTPQEVREFLSKKSHAEKVALRQNATIAPVIARLEANKVKKPANVIDTDSLLGELGASDRAAAADAPKGKSKKG